MEGSPNCAERDSVGVADGSALGRCAGPISSYQTCHRRFQQWVRSGTMKGVLETLALYLSQRCPGRPRSLYRRKLRSSQKGGSKVGKTKRGKGMKIMAVADRHGLPVAVHIESATPHDVKLVVPTLGQMVIPEAPSESGSRQRL